jgi:hypothetical protein
VYVKKLAGVVAAVAITMGVGAMGAPAANAADNIKTFGEQERLNGPNSVPYIGYTVYPLGPSSDPVPHNGTLYAAKVLIDGFGGNTNPMIDRFGARAESGDYYPSIRGFSNGSKLYFDIVGPVPNSVVWNDGTRDILAWIPGELPLEPSSVIPEPGEPAPPAAPFVPPPPAGYAPTEYVPPYTPPAAEAPMPVETDPAIVATPNPIPNLSDPLTEAIVAEPGFNAIPGGGGEGARR